MNVIVIGGGEVGSYLASLWRAGSHNVKIVDVHPDNGRGCRAESSRSFGASHRGRDVWRGNFMNIHRSTLQRTNTTLLITLVCWALSYPVGRKKTRLSRAGK